MPSISFFILGLFVASVIANETIPIDSTTLKAPSAPIDMNTTSTADFTTILTTTSSMNTTTPSTTGDETITNVSDSKTPTPTPISIGTSTSTKPTTTTNNHKTTKPQPEVETGDKVGIIILVLIILAALGFVVVCYFARKRGRHYSVDLTSRPDEANIPLSTIDPEVPVDPAPQNGLQTFGSAETTAKEPQEPEEKPEAQEEQKAEADKSVVEPIAESAAPAPSPDVSEDNPKADVAEQSPPAPVEPSVEEKTDDEGVVSNKTSVESLKETNENNSNNADLCQKRDLKSGNIFWEVSLDCPV